MMRLIEENYKLRDQLRRQEEKEPRDRRDSRDPPKERSRSPKRGRSPKKKVKRESTDEEEERIIRENKRRDRSKSRRRERSGSATEFLKLAGETTKPKSAPPRRARSTKAERRTPKGSVGIFLEKATRSEETPTASEGGPQKPDKRRPREPAYPPGVKAMESAEEREANKREHDGSEKKEKKPKVKAMPSKVKAKPKAGFQVGCKTGKFRIHHVALGVLRGALASNLLSQESGTEEDPDKKAELEKQKKELQRDTPRQSIKITEENMRDQTFHDSRYYADVAAGKPHHIAWKNEKGRRRAVLDRRSDRVSEKLELDDKWHSKHSAPGTGKKRKDLDGLNTDVETEIVDDRNDKSKPIERRDEAAPMSPG